MPIRFGAANVSKIFLGGVEVTKGYLSTDSVFGSYLSAITMPDPSYFVSRVSAGSGIFVAVATQYASGTEISPGVYGHKIYISTDGENWTPVYGPQGQTSSPYVGQLVVNDIATAQDNEIFYLVGSVNETISQTTYSRGYAVLRKTSVQGQPVWSFTLQGTPPAGYSGGSGATLIAADVSSAGGFALTGAGEPTRVYIWNYGATGSGVFYTPTATNSSGMAYIEDLAIGGAEVNNLIVAVGANSGLSVLNFMTSTNGINWTYRTAPESNWWTGVTWGAGKFVAVARSGTTRVATSTDGITWTGRTAAENNYWTAVAYGGGLFVAVANQGTNRMMVSPNGIRWFSVPDMPTGLWADIEYGNGKFIVGGGSSLVVLFDPVLYANNVLLVETITVQSVTAQTSGSDRILTVDADITNTGGLASINDLEYQWQYAAAGSNTWTNIANAAGSVSGANTANLTLTSTYLNSYATRQHRVIVSSILAADAVTSDAVVGLSVATPNVSITQPANATATYSVAGTVYSGYGAYSGTFSTGATTDNANDAISYSWETRQSSSASFAPCSAGVSGIGFLTPTAATITVLSANVAPDQQWASATTNNGMAAPTREYRCRIRVVRQGVTFDSYTNIVQMTAARVAVVAQIANLAETQYNIWSHSYDSVARKHTLTYTSQTGSTRTPCFSVVTPGLVAFKPIPTPATNSSRQNYLIPAPATASIPTEPASGQSPATFKTLWPDATNNGWAFLYLADRTSTATLVNANTVFVLGTVLSSGSGPIYYIGAGTTFELYEM